ncbi:hypothetical protein Bca52824_079742 [Brassica carinata]|uniref:AP180 N-terminal homology (ANTH) domain-containing protein n=1 Tax=Brassica carinata TaxID=52824 RepID=A0A8X7Q1U6_BRACI|nr:hypothetical protein Bca52824_079742 [Brassica carinata]
MKTEEIFTKVQHLQLLLDRFLACRPAGSARNNRVVIVALYPIVKESFQIYYDVTEIMGVLIERFMELDIPDSVKIHDIFCRVSKQFEELDQFYSWSEGDRAYEQEIFFATRRGTRLLNMSDFRDFSRSNSWDYSAFVRTYALYLDDRLDLRMQARHGKRG